MGYILAVSNNKGGVGKTTVAANLAHALANKGKRVLLIDGDSQCNLSSLFASSEIPASQTLYGLLDSQTGGGMDVPEAIHMSREYERISIIPNRPETASLEPDLARRPDFGWTILRDVVRDYAKQSYDYTVIDTPPNLGLFCIQAILCADGILVPVEASSRFSRDGLSKTLSTIEDISSTPGLGDSGKFLRLIINRADRRTAITRVGIEYLQATFDGRVCESIIPASTYIQQAEEIGVTVLRHEPRTPGSTAFRLLAAEVMTLGD